MKARVTIRDVAAKAGVHFATVSRALRGARRVNERTEARIREAARELGYVPDPMLAALCRYRDARHRTTHGIIGYLSMIPLRSLSHAHRQIYDAACARADTLGFRVEFFNLDSAPDAMRQLDRVLYSRNVQGLVLPPVPGEQALTGLEWARFATVAVGYSIVSPVFDRVAPDQPEVMRLHLRSLGDQGYRRIGLVMTRVHSLRTRHSFFSTFLQYQWDIAAADRIPPLVEENVTPEKIRAWRRRHRPDCVISSESFAFDALKADGISIPDKLGFSVLSYRHELPHLAAVEENWPELGAQAVDLVAGLLARSEYGIPRLPRITLVSGGTWKPGASVRRRASQSKRVEMRSRA